MNIQEIKYVIIIPARNEEKFINKTIQSIVSQTITPQMLVIINDGSVDKTPDIIDKWAAKYKWIHHVKRKDRGYRRAGIGVMEAFYTGYNSVKGRYWDFIVKLDADLTFKADYFEHCFSCFSANPKLGIGGGIIYSNDNGKLIYEKNPDFHVRGATKIIRRECWEDIGGFMSITGWDTLDEVKAQMLGWKTMSFPDIILYQQRITGAAAGSWNNYIKNGKANYICGYHPLFMFVKFLRRLFIKPYFLQAFGLLYGYISGFINRIKPIEDRQLVSYLRNQQLRRIFNLKTIWK